MLSFGVYGGSEVLYKFSKLDKFGKIVWHGWLSQKPNLQKN